MIDQILKKMSGKGKIMMIVIGLAAGILLLTAGGGGKAENRSDEDHVSFSEYAESVEKKIHDICSEVDGVSDVKVAVTFESGFEYVYAKNDDKGDLLVIGSGSSESAVKVTEKPPVIGGIGVVCKGGENPTVQKRLIDLLSAAFGISSNKIYITGT